MKDGLFQSDDMASSDRAKELVYTLGLVESILQDSSSAGIGADEELKNSWVPRFLKSGGLDKLTTMMERVLHQLKVNQQSESPLSTEQESKLKEILSYTMKIVKIFVTATVCSIKNDLNADLFSVRSTPSALSKRL